MPFTISHAAAAVPFQRTRLVLSAVIIGSMAPDFEYFLHGRMTSRWSHNLHGAFEFSLPATLIVLAVSHALLKRPVLALSPRSVQERVVLKEFRFWPLSRFLLIVLSALVGIATHLVWDSFTHKERWAVQHIAWFNEKTLLFGHAVPNFKLAQNLSTVVGLLLLLVWFIHWYRNQPTHTESVFSLSASEKVTIVTSIVLVAAVCGFARAYSLVGARLYTAMFVANAVVAFVSIMMLELVIFSIAVRFRMRGAD